MMRYQRVSPDISPLSNGRKPSLKTFKDEALRARSASGSTNPSSPTPRDHQFPSDAPADNSGTPIKPQNTHETTCSVVGYAVGDEFFQWGNRKRSRGSRTESRIASVSASAGTGTGDEASPQKRPGKIPRRSAIAAVMPPPSCAGGFYSRGSNLRSSLMAQLNSSRGVEDRSVCPARSDKRSPPSPPEKVRKMSANGGTADFSTNPDSKQQPSDQETGGSGATATAAEKLNLDHLEWPRIYISLSRKEKEDDFLAMKGTKLPQRPKKRAKNIDKTLQYCFPGMWLADLTRVRYEVREKKCVKKKRRGLKGMESMDSDSE